MRDVARLAGVSVATVSAVINGSATVSEVRSKRVREAMEALDYYPDHVARSLKVGHTSVVGMVVPDITNIFFPEVIRGVEAAARERGYSVILCDCNEDPDQGDIGVAIRRRLKSDLYQTDDRHQRAQVPEPSHREVWTAMAKNQGSNRDSDQEPGSAGELPGGKRLRGQRIKRRQRPGPDHLGQVAGVADEGDLGTEAQRQLIQRAHGPAR